MVSAAALLAACGSGDGSSEPVVVPPVAPTALTLTGAAATGAALAHLVGGPAASAFNSFDASTITDARVQAALTAVGDTLKLAGVDVTAIGNLLTAPLVAANGSTAGNDFDKALGAKQLWTVRASRPRCRRLWRWGCAAPA